MIYEIVVRGTSIFSAFDFRICVKRDSKITRDLVEEANCANAGNTFYNVTPDVLINLDDKVIACD